MKDMLESFKQKVCWQTTKKSNSVILRRCLQITLCVLFSYKIGHTQAAEESATVSLEVDPSNEHPLDDADKAQYDPRFTEAIFDVPRTHKVTKGFVHDPHHYCKKTHKQQSINDPTRSARAHLTLFGPCVAANKCLITRKRRTRRSSL